jgi:Protein of unknown function (DUF1360)
MQPFLLRFDLAVLATWRVTHLLANEDGPADLILRFRRLLGQSLAGSLMDCFQCLSLWIAAASAFYVTRSPLEWTFTWLALSGAACLLERIVKDPVAISMTAQPTEGEQRNVLRIETHGMEDEPADAGPALKSAKNGRSAQD